MGGKKAAAKADKKAKKMQRASGGSSGVTTTAMFGAIAVVLAASLASFHPRDHSHAANSAPAAPVWTAGDEAAAAARVTDAKSLLDAMETAGATLHVPLEARAVPFAGGGSQPSHVRTH